MSPPEVVGCRLLGRVVRAPGVESFRLAPETPLSFLAGQYVQVCFDPGNPGNRDLNKFLSLSSPPGRPHLEVTKKLSESAFSARLRALGEGDSVALRGPFGDCVLRSGDRRVAFLAGGIGITPVVSMVEHALERRPELEMRLFYSNRREEEFAFKEDFAAWAEASERLGLHLFLTAGTPSDPRIESGRISRERLAEALPDPAAWVCFVFGPPPMVEAMRASCLEIGVPEPQVRSEGFAGY